MAGRKEEPLWSLIRSMSKAEKRNFKLYATRLSGNDDAKFIALFDHMESAGEYDEALLLKKCPVKKEQLPNMKAHLYKQILTSLRLLTVRRWQPMHLRQQIDFARILYDKGLYSQSARILEKALELSEQIEEHTMTLEIIEALRLIEAINPDKAAMPSAEALSQRATELCAQLDRINELSNISSQLYSLHLKLGYARTQKDLNLIVSYFKPKLDSFSNRRMSFSERFHFYQAMAWYHYIMHDFLQSYRYGCYWVGLFDTNPVMKELMYDNYLKGYSRILDGLSMMRKYKLLVQKLERLEQESAHLGAVNDNAVIISRGIILMGRINVTFIEGAFEKADQLAGEVNEYMSRYSGQLNIHQKMLLNYKVACLYFGQGSFRTCMRYLSQITETRDPQIRRDLQCFAKMLHLIASYEVGDDYNLEYQIRSTYSFLVKMNDMHGVQREMLSFLRRLGGMYASNMKEELRVLYQRLKPYENSAYERRPFYYLDILSWLESKISGTTVGEVIRRRFNAEFPKFHGDTGRK